MYKRDVRFNISKGQEMLLEATNLNPQSFKHNLVGT